MTDKAKRIFVDTPNRTFETRLKFLVDIFSDRADDDEIMANCIKFKLQECYKQYADELRYNTFILANKDPMKVLKKIK